MKKVFLSLLLTVLVLPVFAQRTLRVSTVEDLVKSIRPNVIIELEDGIYDIGAHAMMGSGPTAFAEPRETYEGFEYLFKNATNLTIRGVGNNRAEIVNLGAYSTVMLFQGCDNLTLENLEIGHGPSKGECTGGVLDFSNIHDINIKNCILYGSGTYGITTNDVFNLNVENTVIRNCTYGIMVLNASEDVTFSNCSFYGSHQFDLIEVNTCRNVLFDRCEIKDNTTMYEYDNCYYSLFKVTGRPIELRDCIVRYNTACYLGNKSRAYTATGSTDISYNIYNQEFEQD